MALFYRGKNNRACLQLKKTDCATGQVSPVDLSGVTKTEIFFNGVNYDSDQYPQAFDWNVDPVNGRLDLMLGNIPTIDAAKDSKSEFSVYDPSNPDGVMWGLLFVQVRDIE